MKVWFQPTQNAALQWFRYYAMQKYLPETFHAPEFKQDIPDIFWERQMQDGDPSVAYHFEKIIDSGYKAVIIQRVFRPAGLAVIELLKHNNIKVYAEMDDGFELSPSHPAFVAFENTSAKDVAQEQARISDGIYTTTEYLKEQFLEYNKNVAVVPNAIDASFIKKPCCTAEVKRIQSRKDGKIKIIYACSASHDGDIRAVYPELLQFAEEHKDVAEVELIGGVYNFIKRNDCIKKTPVSLKIFDYYDYLGETGFHIGIAPLVTNEFNLCKSNLRFLEYSALGGVTVAANMGEFKKPIADGHCIGASMYKKGDFYNALKKAVEHGKMELEQKGSLAKSYCERKFHIMDSAKALEKFIIYGKA